MVGAGLVASLARPGGNTTGISLLSPELDGKRQDLLIDMVPGARRMAALYDSTVTPGKHLEGLQSAARAPGIELSIFGVAKVEGIVPAFDAASSGAAASNGIASRAAYIKAKTDHDDFMALAPVRVGPECRLRARWPRRLPRIPHEISRRRPRSPQLAGFLLLRFG